MDAVSLGGTPGYNYPDKTISVDDDGDPTEKLDRLACGAQCFDEFGDDPANVEQNLACLNKCYSASKMDVVDETVSDSNEVLSLEDSPALVSPSEELNARVIDDSNNNDVCRAIGRGCLGNFQCCSRTCGKKTGFCIRNALDCRSDCIYKPKEGERTLDCFRRCDDGRLALEEN